MAQLPATFGPNQLTRLRIFIESNPLPVALAVEVRHPQFFAKGEVEKNFNRLLLEHSVNRVIMDTRALFATPPQSLLEVDVQNKKPKVPVNVISTGTYPVIRFVGGNHKTITEQKLIPWIRKCHQWRQEGKSPYMFIHCADNAQAPFLLQRFIELYNQINTEHKLLPLNIAGSSIDKQQQSLF